MLFDRRCAEGVRYLMDCDRTYLDFHRASNMRMNDDEGIELVINNDTQRIPFIQWSQAEWKSLTTNAGKAIGASGVHNFGKYAVYCQLHEQNKLNDFFNFAKTRGYQRVYAN